MISHRCLYTFLVLFVFASVVLGDPGKKDVASRDKNSVRVADKQNKGLKRKSKSRNGKGKGRNRRKRKRKSKKIKTKKDKKDRQRKRQKGGDKGKDKRKGRRRVLKADRMTPRCQNVTCLNDMLKVLKINKDTVRNFLKQEKRLMGR